MLEDIISKMLFREHVVGFSKIPITAIGIIEEVSAKITGLSGSRASPVLGNQL